jgi:type I restriction enzyme S subunit
MSDLIEPRYLHHFFQSSCYRRKVSSLAAGANINNLKNEHIDDLEIPLPPLEEQRRIAAILDRGNQLSQLRERSRKALELLKQAVFRSALASHEASSSDSTANELGECLSFITSGGRGWSQYYADSGPRFIRSGDVRMNQINRLSPQYISPPDNAEARRTRILDGDVLLTITGSRIGRVAPAASDDSGAYVSQHVAILRLDRSKLIPSFVSFFLSMPGLGQSQIKKAQYGQTKPGLNFEQIRRFSIPSLSIDEQQQIMNKIESVQSLLNVEQSQSLAISEMLASLCLQAFSGGF